MKMISLLATVFVLQAKDSDLAGVDAKVTDKTNRVYAAMVQAMDKNVAAILAELDRLGLHDQGWEPKVIASCSWIRQPPLTIGIVRPSSIAKATRFTGSRVPTPTPGFTCTRRRAPFRTQAVRWKHGTASSSTRGNINRRPVEETQGNPVKCFSASSKNPRIRDKKESVCSL